MFDLSGRKVFVAGHRGLVGSALMRRLAREDCEVLSAGRETLDLRDQRAVDKWFDSNRPDVVILAAAKVGGIHANASQPAEFLHDNLAIQTNVMAAGHRYEVAKLLFLASSCIYPVGAPQPLAETALLKGELEPSHLWYGTAKIAGMLLARAYRQQYGHDFITVLPTNLYGPGDNFDPATSHVLPALIGKVHAASRTGDPALPVWGTGTPRREFMHVDDCADACVHLLRHYSSAEPINLGWGTDIAILDLARLICEVVGYAGAVVIQPDKPDGAPRKLLDVTKLTGLGWQARIGLRQGIAATYQWYCGAIETGQVRKQS
jgi:GDP-L-fucose synthase